MYPNGIFSVILQINWHSHTCPEEAASNFRLLSFCRFCTQIFIAGDEGSCFEKFTVEMLNLIHTEQIIGRVLALGRLRYLTLKSVGLVDQNSSDSPADYFLFNQSTLN